MPRTTTPAKSKSQVKATPTAYKLLAEWQFLKIKTENDLITLRDKLLSHLEFRPYDDSTQEEEKKIRWKRTGSEILRDRYVYQGKACTDLVIAFITLARTAGIKNTCFVKLINKQTGAVHSVGEFELPDGWYIFDIAHSKTLPIKGRIIKNVPFGIPPLGPYLLWKKGRDSWDLGLTEFKTINKIK